MQAPNLSLYLVTQENYSDCERFIEIIHKSVLGGVSIVQLRDKQSSARSLCALGSRLLNLLRPMGIPLIINDRVDIAYAIGADGVHLGQSDLPPSKARSLLGPYAIIGLSVSSLEQALEAEELEVDYLAASPVFPSTTKLDCEACWSLPKLKELCSRSRHPIVAIGGINQKNAPILWNSGVSGIAVVSAIFNAPIPEEAARQLTVKP